MCYFFLTLTTLLICQTRLYPHVAAVDKLGHHSAAAICRDLNPFLAQFTGNGLRWEITLWVAEHVIVYDSLYDTGSWCFLMRKIEDVIFFWGGGGGF